MDVGNKTLAQLSLEGKEKMYVTLEVGSKISGYTKEYLERLCRLEKVEYRLRGGDHVIELTSLLDATHTILLSYEDITFVDKSELSAPTQQEAVLPSSGALREITPENATVNSEATRLFSAKLAQGITQEVPRFGDANRTEHSGVQAFSIVGRAVVSDGTTSIDNTGNETHTPLGGIEDLPQISEALSPAEIAVAISTTVVKSPPAYETPSVVIPRVEVSVTTPAPAVEHVKYTPVQLAIGEENPASPIPVPRVPTPGSVISKTMATPAHIPRKPAVRAPVHLHVVREKEKPKEEGPDEWEHALLGIEASVTPEAIVQTTAALPASPYRPIVTSIDATAHHDPAPLFPVVGTLLTIPERIKTETRPGIPDLGKDKQVVVFAPQEYVDAHIHKEVAPPTPAAVAADTFSTTIAKVTEIPIVPVRPTLPQIRVMSQVSSAAAALPMLSEEHQLVLRQQHPLTKSTSFNVAFAALFVGFSVAILGGLLHSSGSDLIASVSYVAAVGSADLGVRAATPASVLEPEQESPVLPFSDETVVTLGETPNSIVVQPVFKDGIGKSYEYTVVGTTSEITRTPEQLGETL